ncbi:MAG: putative porin [Odoribacter sp.]
MYFISLAQSDFDYNDSPARKDDMRQHEQDSVKKSNVKHFRYTWQWFREGVYPQEIALDTLQDGIHNFNYIFKQNISNTYLANLPSPYESNIFFTRETVEDFYPLTNIRAFLFKPEDAVHFNTTTPFTRLRYFTGGGKGKGENFIDVWHVQNILPFWSAGIRYNLISSDGRYMNQKAKSYNCSIFSSYEKERTVVSFFLNQNNGHFSENGGIKDRSFVLDSTGQKSENIPVRLAGSDASNNYRNTNFQAQMQYNIGNKKEKIIGKDTSYSYPTKAIVNFRAEGNEHWYKEKSGSLEFYPHTYIDSTSSYDLVNNQIFDVSAKLVMNEHPKYTYLPGLYAGIDFKYEKYRQRTGYDSISKVESFGRSNYSGTYLTGGVFNVDTNALLNYDIAGRLCLAGHYVGNFKFDGFISQALRKDRSSLLRANATVELKSVNPFFDRYVGNHNIWENNFKAIKTIKIEGRYINSRLRTELGVGIHNVFSYVFFDTAAMPQQTSKTLMVLSAWAKEHFKAGNFHFDQTVYFQKSTQEDILSLPAISVYSHNYYQNDLFKKALSLQIGFDMFYNTQFYSDNYMPSIMQFYNQRERKTGNYPKFDVFLSLRIKRADIFVKYEHVNYILKDHGEFLSALDYPINPGMLKFGIKWDFFD